MALIDQSSPANARITLGGLTLTITNIVALRNLSGPDLMGLVQTQYDSTFQDGLGMTYIWNPTDATPDNGSTVIAPYVGPATGRWNVLAEASPAGSGALSITNVATLKAVSGPSSGTIYITEGYYTAGDGGQGAYVWNAASTATDNGGTVLALTAGGTGRFNLLNKAGTAFARQFGAKGDGTTNDSPAMLNCLEYCREQNNLGTPMTLYLDAGSYRITFAKGQSNTDPFANQNAKSWYVFTIANDGTGWTPSTPLSEGDPASLSFRIVGVGLPQILHDGDANSWLWSMANNVNAGVLAKLDLSNIYTKPYNPEITTHGWSFDQMWFFLHENLTTSNFQYGVGMQYRRVERGSVIGRTSLLCLRGLVLGDPDATNPATCSCNEVDFVNDVIMYCGTTMALSSMDKLGFVELWQAQSVRFLGTSWKANSCAALVVSCINIIIDSPYFEFNGPPINGVLTGISSLLGGSGYTNGETVIVATTDGSGAGAQGTAVVAGGAITGITGLGGYSTVAPINYGFATGRPCSITGQTSGASNATCTAVVAGLPENWGLINNLVINPTIAPLSANYGIPNAPYVANLIMRGGQLQYSGILFRASSAKQIGVVTLDETSWYQPDAVSGLHWVSGEEAYIGLIRFNCGDIAFNASAYIPQISVNGSTYAWIANYTTRVLPLLIQTNSGGTLGIRPAIKTVAIDYGQSGNTNNVTGDGTVYTLQFPNLLSDDNSNFNPSTGTFTAPVLGWYRFDLTLALIGLTTSHVDMELNLYINGSTSRQLSRLNPGAMMTTGSTNPNQVIMTFSKQANLQAGAAVTFVLTISGGGKTVTITGSTELTAALLS